jgi:hypothetical protein
MTQTLLLKGRYLPYNNILSYKTTVLKYYLTISYGHSGIEPLKIALPHVILPKSS